MAKWNSDRKKFPGVRWREHESRKLENGQPDRYFQLRFSVNGQKVEEAVGWQSDPVHGLNLREAYRLLCDLRASGETLSQRRQREADERDEDRRQLEAAKQKRKIEKKLNKSVADLWQTSYFPNSQAEKHPETASREKSLFTKWLSPVIGDLPLKSIEPRHLDQIVNAMRKEGLSARSIVYALSVVRHLYNYCIEYGLVTSPNHLAGILKRRIKKLNKTPNERIRFLTREEADELLPEIEKTDQTAWRLAMLSFFTGARASELFRLRWQHIDFDRGMITFEGGRHSKSRIRRAAMTKRVRQMLEAMHQGAGSDLLFPSPSGDIRREVPKSFAAAVNKLKFNDGIEDQTHRVVFHTCRHSYASWMVQSGVSLYELQGLMGHSTIAMTQRYAHLQPDFETVSAKVLDD